MPDHSRAKARVLIALFIALLAMPVFVSANPEFDHVSSGDASVSQSGTTTVINQTSDKAIIEWNTFNIDSNETTHFQQPANGVALNRINPSNGASQILGTLTATGKIILVNQAGIFFGPGARVDVGGIIASTTDISNDNFLAGKYIFDRASSYDGASITNQGVIKANYGLAALVGNNVTNSGLIEARLGSIVLASGSKYTVSFDDTGLINFAIDTPSDSHGKVTNTGKLIANGGTILVTAQTAKNVVDNVIDMQGVAIAHSVSQHGGVIYISGSGNVHVSGKLIASSKRHSGGTIQVSGDNIHIASTAVLNADGALGGGTIKLSSNSMSYAEVGAVLSANATQQGNGGNISVLSDSETAFHGSISAQGGPSGGDGGFVETSGFYLDVAEAAINLLAPAGIVGTWLLDPSDVTISSSATNNETYSGGTYTPGSSNTSTILASELLGNLATSNVSVVTTSSGTANGDIAVNSALSWSAATTLSLTATRNIYLNADITATNGGLTLSAKNGTQSLTTGTIGSGTLGGTVSSVTANINVANFILLQGQWFQVATTLPTFTVSNNFKIATGTGAFNNTTLAQFTRLNTTSTPYGITDVYGLQGIATGPNTTNYILSNDIDATSTTNWTNGSNGGFIPIGVGSVPYDGTFNGQGHTINKLYINNPNIFFAGLFGTTTNATLENFNLTNVNITAVGTHIAAVDGQNTTGSIINVTATGTLNLTGSDNAGLVGTNTGSINNSSVNVTLNELGSSKTGIGGLIGTNSGSVSNSYSTSSINVSGNSNSNIGGLIGQNTSTATLSNVYSTGTITLSNTGTANSNIGGLIGLNAQTAAINGSGSNVGPCNGSICTTTTISVTGTLPNFIGGFIGNSSATSFSNLSMSNVTVTGNAQVGGFIGNENNSTGSISNVTLTNVGVSGNFQAGTFIGQNNSSITNSSVSGNSTLTLGGSGQTQSGGFVGTNNGGTFTNDYTTANLVINTSGGIGIGGFVGQFNSGTINSAYDTGNLTFTSTSSSQSQYIGGFVGAMGAGTINGGNGNYGPCTGSVCATGNMILTSNATVPINIGGFLGMGSGGTITNITNHFISVTGNSRVGGFAGIDGSNGSLTNSSSTTNVIQAGVSGQNYVGGFVGLDRASGTFSYNNDSSSGTITITGTVANVGGFIGGSTTASPTYTNLTTTSNIVFTSTASGDSNIGGFVGFISANNNYASGNTLINNNSITYANNMSSLPTNVGGFVGENDGKLANAVSNGMTIIGSSNVGPLVGLNKGTIASSSSNNSYAIISSGTADASHVAGGSFTITGASSGTLSNASGTLINFARITNYIGNGSTPLSFSVPAVYNDTTHSATVGGSTLTFSGVSIPSGSVNLTYVATVVNTIVNTVVSTTIPPPTPYTPAPIVMMTNMVTSNASVNTNINTMISSVSGTSVLGSGAASPTSSSVSTSSPASSSAAIPANTSTTGSRNSSATNSDIGTSDSSNSSDNNKKHAKGN